MGLAASQARLLSITARLSDNELHSQQISNSKVRLADRTQEASQEYIQALNSSKLMFSTYDAEGNVSQTTLTPSLLYTYTPLKNQYALQDASGAFYVSAVDAQNYENTNSLMEFLACYDLFSDKKYQEAVKDYNDKLEDYNKDKDKYDQEKLEFDKAHDEWQVKHDAWVIEYNKYLEDLKEWNEIKDKPNLYDQFAGFVGTSDNPNSQAGFCYDRALEGNVGCYKHLLAHLLDYSGASNFSKDTYETSYIDPATGKKDTTKLLMTSGGMTSYVMNDPKWLEIVDAINDESRKCDEDDNYNGVDDEAKDNSLQAIIDAGGVPTKKDILMSDYLYDPDTNSVTGVKTLKQKAIDILYLLNNQDEFNLTTEEMKETLINFTDGDMRNLGKEPEPPGNAPTEPVFTQKEPEEPVKPNYSVELDDKEKAQWYVNLWYMMNGSDSANLVKNDSTTELDGVFIVAAESKSNKGNYKVLEDNLMTSPDWIQFALEQGIVTLVKAQYYDPTEDNGKAGELTSEGIFWTATNWSSCTDMSSTEDAVAIARAETEYNQKLRDIESKDKKFDNDLKKLDTEHNALQTEYESVKSVIEKNTERSFKAFS